MSSAGTLAADQNSCYSIAKCIQTERLNKFSKLEFACPQSGSRTIDDFVKENSSLFKAPSDSEWKPSI